MSTHQDEAPTGTTGVANGAGPTAAAAGAEPEASPQAAGWRRFRYTLPGVWVALVFACLAFTPSLLPRSAVLQGVVCGISAAIGYGVGVAGAWTWRVFADREPRPPRPGPGGCSLSRPRSPWSSPLSLGSGGRPSSAT